MRPISNLNSNVNNLSVKNYIPGSDTLAVIRELKKLGILKSVTKAKGRSKPKMIEDIKQPSDMVGYTRTLSGLSPQMRNIPPIQQILPGMTQQQIENIQRVNAARFAALEGEVQQHRSETKQTIGGIVNNTSKQMDEIASGLNELVNPQKERFRGSTFPAQQQGEEPVDPFEYARGGRAPREFMIPDTNDVPMDQTLNEGGPEATPEFATTLYPTEETGNIGIPTARIQPQEKIDRSEDSLFNEFTNTLAQQRQMTQGLRATRQRDELRQQAADQLELGKIPTKNSSKRIIVEFYNSLADSLNIDRIDDTSKDEYLFQISKLLDTVIDELISEGKL